MSAEKRIPVSALALVGVILLIGVWGGSALLRQLNDDYQEQAADTAKANLQSLAYGHGYALGKRQRLDGNTETLPNDELNIIAKGDAAGHGYKSQYDIDLYTTAFSRGYDAGLHPRFKWSRLFKPNYED